MSRLAHLVAVLATIAAACGGCASTHERPSHAVGREAAGGFPADCPSIRVNATADSAWGREIVNGGCGFGASAQVVFHLLSVAADVRFVECEVEFMLRIDEDGMARVDDVEIRGGSLCNDVIACTERFEPTKPWTGRIRPRDERSFLLSLDVCFDTCMGRFAGRLDTMLEHRGRDDWRLKLIADGRVGTSGWRLGVPGWQLTPADSFSR